MNIVITIPSLGLGGAEGVAARLADHLARDHRVTVVTRSSKEDFYRLDPEVNRRRVTLEERLGGRLFSGLGIHLSYIRKLRSVIEELDADCVVSFTNRNNVQTLLAAARRFPVVISERNYPPANPIGAIWEFLRRLTYPRAEMLVSVSHGTDSCFAWLPEKRRAVIHNPVSPHSSPGPRPDLLPRQRCHFLSAGRLHAIKDYPTLMKAFARIAPLVPDWDLVILGEGEERPALELLIADLDLSERVLMPGRVENVGDYIREADVFVLSSLSEGFPNVILEAQEAGTPVISTNCPTGPGEIIDSGRNGMLVPVGNPQLLARTMEKLATSTTLREELAKNAMGSVTKYAGESIFRTWEELIVKVVSESSRRGPRRKRTSPHRST